MKLLRLHLSTLACALLASGLHAAVPLRDARISGDSSSVASGTLTVQDTATLAIAEGGAFTVDADAVVTFGAALSLANGGTGSALTDPGADRLGFWDDSAGVFTWLQLGGGLSISGTTINTTSGAGFENPMTTADDLIVGGVGGAATRLGVGSEGQILKVVSGAVAWASGGSGAGAPDDATYIVQVADGDLPNAQALGALATGLVKNTTTTGVLSIATAGTDYAAAGSVTTSGLQMNTGYLAGRTTASAGAVEEIAVGSGLTLSAGTLSATGGGSLGGSTGSTDNALIRADGTGGSTVQTSNVTLADSGTALVFSGAAGLTASGSNQDVTLTPSGTGAVQIVRNTIVRYAGANTFLSVETDSRSLGSTFGVFQQSSVARDYGAHFSAEPTTSDFLIVSRAANVDSPAMRIANSDRAVTFYGAVRIGASGPAWHVGTGSPESVVTAPVGSLYSRTDGGAGTSLYVKESGTGSTGWIAK